MSAGSHTPAVTRTPSSSSAKALVLAGLLATAAAAAGCSRGSSRGAGDMHNAQRDPADSARVAKSNTKPTAPQAKDLQGNMEATLTRDLAPFFIEAHEESLGDSPTAKADAARLGQASALAIAKKIIGKARGDIASNCSFNVFALEDWGKCVVRESLTQDLSSATGLRALLASVAKQENERTLGDIASLNALVQKQGDATLAKVTKLVSSSAKIEGLLARAVKSIESVKGALSLLAQGKALADAPYISENFFKDRSFVLTTSFAQGSVGSERLYNLANDIVRLEVNSGRLVLIRDKQDLYDSEGGVDVILAAYPISSTVTVGKETYFQIDFSQPANKEFLVPVLAGPGASQLSLSADVVVPRVAHAAKKKIDGLASGLYFNGMDDTLVIDELVLVNGTDAVLSTDRETNPAVLGKDSVRPTVRIVQGLFAVAKDDNFALSQRQDIADAQRWLGVDDRSKSGNPTADAFNVPYFGTDRAFLEDAGGRARMETRAVRKFNREKDITWVVSANTPDSAVPVVKSAVLSFQTLMNDLAPKDQKPTVVKVLTQTEFEAANRTQGLKLGDGPLHAADPRVNMILWDENDRLGSAWATAVANPRTGEVISADVMLSGTMWAKEGCKGFMHKTWKFADEPSATNRKKGPVPSAMTRFLWDLKCETVLFKAGFYKPLGGPEAAGPGGTGGEAGGPFPFPPIPGAKSLEEATRTHDFESLAAIASSVLKRNVTVAEVRGDAVSQAALPLLENGEVDESALPASLRKLRAQIKGFSPRLTDMKAVKEAARAAASDFAGKTSTAASGLSSTPFVSLASGKNLVRTAVDCLRVVTNEGSIELADYGSPAIESNEVKTPLDGAFALLRSTVVHELGHAFGLRHNFMGSLATAKLEENATPAIATMKRSDSVMDYNEYAIDFDSGAMGDYTRADGESKGHATFGAYDVLALANIYGLDVSSLRTVTKPAFCTDGNVLPLGECQRSDYGNDYVEFLSQQVNMDFQRLKNVQAVDFILTSAPEVILPLLSRLENNLRKLTFAWALAQRDAAATSVMADKAARLLKAELAYRGAAAQQDFLKDFEKRYGSKLKGVRDMLVLEPAEFDDAALSDLLRDLVRSSAQTSVLSTADMLTLLNQDDASDDAYFSPFNDVRLGADLFPYRTDLLDLSASRILVPAGRALPYAYFADGTLKKDSLTVDGEPLQMKLDVPFLNHVGQTTVLRNVLTDDEKNPGQKIARVVTLRGQEKLSQMVLDALLAATVAPGYSASASAVRLTADEKALAALVAATPESCKPGTPACYMLSSTAVPAAGFLLGLYSEAVDLASAPIAVAR